MAEQLLAWLVQVGLFPQALLGPGGRKYVISKTITNCSVWGYEDFWGQSVKGVVAETAKDNLDTAKNAIEYGNTTAMDVAGNQIWA